MSLHAIEIILTRTVSGVELQSAKRAGGMPMASSSDGKRIVVLVSAKSVNQAIKKVWRRLEEALPIDVLCTLFPGPDGMLRMSIPFTPEDRRRIRTLARATGKSAEDFLSDAVSEALARDRSDESARRDCVLNLLFHRCTFGQVPLSSSGTLPISVLPSGLSDLVRRVSVSGDRVRLVDDGRPVAVLIGEQTLADLEDELAIAECRMRKADGTPRIPHDEAVEEAAVKDGEEGEGNETAGSTGV
ncbi:hypothetical protein RB628_40260 [Streptomyces sp. ADMS]|uniref:hypothetical protein n=1 Tax=Streptomyces sp. ADMS TaxID=3071415 RepID=UPI00296F99B7|nr:hypothetical protein [Streptomyces sp. ADMS]MDW4911359.1 hypothetical protein [Streptomyces sp. ADMS]